MTQPADAVTVGDLREWLARYEDDVPVAVNASGAYDFLCERGLKTAELKRPGDPGPAECVFLDGDRQ